MLPLYASLVLGGENISWDKPTGKIASPFLVRLKEQLRSGNFQGEEVDEDERKRTGVFDSSSERS